jgi:hypothetical protein
MVGTAQTRLCPPYITASHQALVIVGAGLPAHFRIQVAPWWKFWISPGQNTARHSPP